MGRNETQSIAIGTLVSFALLFAGLLAASVELASSLIVSLVAAALMFLFLFATGRHAASFEPRMAMRTLAFGIPSLLVATALMGAGCAVTELLRLDDKIKGGQTLVLFGVLWLVAWAAFGRWARGQDGPELRRKGLLLVGSVCLLVVLVSWGIERVTSRRDEFMAGIGGAFGMAIGVLVGYWALSVLLIARFSPVSARAPAGGGG
jgi:hypothetical protein